MNRFITQKEYNEALELAKSLDFETIFVQKFEPDKHMMPDFQRAQEPFANQ
jgi:hypothetical protein